MKKSLVYSAIVLLLAAMACNKTDSTVSEGESHILFAPAAEATRALVYQDNLTSEQFRVYDFKDDVKYIDDQIKYEEGWVYVSGDDYLWKAGTHKLFGYTTALGALPENKKLSYTKELTTALANQADLLYSGIVTTTADTWKHTTGNTKTTPVKLSMKHLFAAVEMAVKNGKGATIQINSVTVPSIPNSATATIDYSGTDVAVSIPTAPTAGTNPFVSAAAIGNVDLTDTAQLDILTQAVQAPAPYVVWPQTIPAMTIAVQYTQNGSTYNTTATIPSITWEAGKLYTYTLLIANVDDILLNFTVQDWVDGGSETAEFE